VAIAAAFAVVRCAFRPGARLVEKRAPCFAEIVRSTPFTRTTKSFNPSERSNVAGCPSIILQEDIGQHEFSIHDTNPTREVRPTVLRESGDLCRANEILTERALVGSFGLLCATGRR